jgi:hypothetical protein
VVDDVLRLGVLAGPKLLALFHHDPDRSDEALDAIAQRAGRWVEEHTEKTRLIVAREGQIIEPSVEAGRKRG